MIEHHRNGRQQHMLVDDEGWAALKSGVATVSTLDPGTHLAGLDIYRDKCPCPENVETQRCTCPDYPGVERHDYGCPLHPTYTDNVETSSD